MRRGLLPQKLFEKLKQLQKKPDIASILLFIKSYIYINDTYTITASWRNRLLCFNRRCTAN